ncbi:MAG: ABC transporter ATP-binding protein [Chloroflexi bacterium]|nr:ABC transporter ATP-binding protein [Chloroflexota bacterium]MCI0769237.1 ABC transporter ATP-binding protein [Chloroflexota bacterium]
MRILWRILGFLKPHKKLVLAAYVSLIGSSLLYLALPRLVGESIDQVLDQGDFSFLVYAGAAIVGLTLIRAVFAYFESYLREALSQLVAYGIRNAMYDHLQRMSFAYHDKQQTGQLMSRATADVENIRWFVSLAVVRMSYLIFLVGGVGTVMLLTNWALALVTMAFIPVLILRGAIIGRRLRVVWLRAQERTGELTTILQESLSGIKVVKAFDRQDHEGRKFSGKAGQLADEHLRVARIQASNMPMMTFLFTAVTGLVLWFGGREVIAGRLSPGELTQFILYLAMLQMPVRMIGFMINLASRAVSSGQRIFEILDADSPVKEKAGAVALDGIRGHVVLDHVSFRYDAASDVLIDISVEVQPGQVVALLGATGSGKSTIVHLLPRFYDVTGGRVLIDGMDVRDLTLQSLRNNVGIVQQDVFLFSATIRDNIAYGAINATDEQVEWAAKVSRMHDFIMGMPQGYQTWVGERGITLSGGQKQRVAIARTLLRDPRILILDDSTSSVDTRTEFQIRQALEELMKSRTTFVIAQRLSTVKNADLILVLENGRIAQRGTHEELLAQGGLYREIYELQLRPQEEASQAAAAGEAAS